MIIRRQAVQGMLACTLLTAVFPRSAEAVPLRQAQSQWTPASSIPIRYVVRNQRYGYSFVEANDGDFGQPVWYSPNGSRFFFLTQRGDLACDCSRYELWIYSVDRVRRALRQSTGRTRGLEPDRREVVESRLIDSDAPASGITDAAWEDEDSLVYAATVAPDRSILYRVDLASGQRTALTGEGQISNVQRAAGALLYLSGSMARERMRLGYPMQPMRGDAFADRLSDTYRSTTAIHGSAAGGASRLFLSYETPNSRISPRPFAPRLSPDGRWAVAAVPAFQADRAGEVATLVEGWGRYAGTLGLDAADRLGDRRFRMRPSQALGRAWRIVLIDMRQGGVRTIVDAPMASLASGRRASALWSPDGSRLTISNWMAPGQESGGGAGQARRLDYDVGADRLSTVAAPPAEQQAVASPVPAPASRQLQQLPDGWLDVRVDDDLNRPPAIVAREGGRMLDLTGPDPALAALRLAPTRIVHWRDPEGQQVEGGLILPASAGPRPYPLVVQLDYRGPVDNPENNRFLPDGRAGTAHAAQALAARGIAVLRLETSLPRPAPGATAPLVEREAALMSGRIEAAIRSLSAQGIVDEGKVGLIGFSRMGYYVNYYLTHPGRLVPAAAIIADSTTASYVEYVSALARTRANDVSAFVRSAEQLYAGSPWDSPDIWARHAPGYNIRNIRAPVLFTDSLDSSHLGMADMSGAETIAGFRRNDREADFLTFPDGGHNLQRPAQRLASMEATVDWMAFWLLGEEIDPARKEDQYAYWRSLRDRRDARRGPEGSGRSPAQ